MIYLDYAASTPVKEQVKQKLLQCLDEYGNPSSMHEKGIKAKNLIEESKDIISKSLNVNKDNLYFTSGATMSNNIMLQGFQGDVLVSAIEHEDIMLLNKNRDVIQVDDKGFIDIEDLKSKLYKIKNPTLIVIQAANGEIGTIQNIELISSIVHQCENVYLHVDATQYVPYFNMDVTKLRIDSLSMSGQKIGCIKGVGLLYMSDGIKEVTSPLLFGEQGFIGGTENVSGIACLGEAFLCLNHDNDKIIKLRDKMIDGINGELVGSTIDRLPNNVNFLFKGIASEVMVEMLNERGIYCSSGSACSNNNDLPSHTLLAIGMNENDANSCVRFTLGENNTDEEIDEVIAQVNDLVNFFSCF